MNEQNFDYIKNQLKYTSFGEELGRELREKVSKQAPDFTLMHKVQFGNEQTEAVLHFKKSKENDMHFFNRFFLQLKNEKGEEAFTQSFRVGRENNVTLKQAYNLMNGRAIHKEHVPKEGEKYNAWFASPCPNPRAGASVQTETAMSTMNNASCMIGPAAIYIPDNGL